MRPPEWALEGSTRLSLDEFTAEFGRTWARMSSRFLKIECWQSYQEAATNRSQEAFQRGDFHVARTLLRQEAEDDRPLYDDVRRREIDYARIRLIHEPLSPYLEYELVNYDIRASLGEQINVVLIDPSDPLPGPDRFDFLLFDRHTALIHDYGTGSVGHQIGGWLTQQQDTMDALEAIATGLRQRSTPLSTYRARRGGSCGSLTIDEPRTSASEP